jgi:hypothetical protein
VLLIVTKTQAKAIRLDVNTRTHRFVCLGLYSSVEEEKKKKLSTSLLIPSEEKKKNFVFSSGIEIKLEMLLPLLSS